MGGKSSSTQTQSSTTAPWEAAQPALQGILGQLNSQLGSTGLTGAENSALNTISANGQNQFAPQINDLASRLFAGGGATAQSGALQGGMDQLNARLSGAADPNYSSLNDPKLRAALDQIQSDVGNSVNGQFAAAGRDLSGANQMAYGRGVSAAQAPLILDQFNKDRTLQQGAAGTLFNAQNTTSGLLSGLNQQDIANRTAGIDVAKAGIDAKNSGATAVLEAEAARRGIPAQALGLLAQIGIPIAGLGSQSTGTATGTQQMSGAQQFGLITGGLANLFGGGRR